ncbi:MAG: hypothetical protein WBD31_21845 [Rubripirellula sp.]
MVQVAIGINPATGIISSIELVGGSSSATDLMMAPSALGGLFLNGAGVLSTNDSGNATVVTAGVFDAAPHFRQLTAGAVTSIPAGAVNETLAGLASFGVVRRRRKLNL